MVEMDRLYMDRLDHARDCYYSNHKENGNDEHETRRHNRAGRVRSGTQSGQQGPNLQTQLYNRIQLEIVTTSKACVRLCDY